MERKRSALEQRAADALRRARRLPIGADRNDLRQLAMGLLWLQRNGMDALMNQRSAARFKRKQASQDVVLENSLQENSPREARTTS
jgi:hypothetical protein